MKYNILVISFLILIVLSNPVIGDNNYIINNDTVYIDDSKVYLSATPHTLSSSGWVYFNLTSKIYTGNIDACWGFNTSVSKPTKAEVYSPHWVNTTTNHKKTFYNVSFIVYTGDDLDYGNSYNTNYKYTITESVVNDNGTTYITSNAAFDSYTTDGTNYTIYWYTRHDNYYLWKDFSPSFNSIVFDFKGYNKWYYIKNIFIISNKEYIVRAWIDVPVSTEKQSGKYYFAIKPSHETISQAVTNEHFYNLDPWWNATWSNRKNITLTGKNIIVSFNNPSEDGHIFKSIGYTRDSTGNMISFGCEDEAGYITRGYIEWDISSLPIDAIIINTTLKYHGYHAGDAHIHEMIGTRPSTSGDSNVYNESGEGTVYADVAGFPTTGTNKEINLGINAVSDLELSIANGWFAIGLQQDNENPTGAYSGIYSEDYASVNPKPTLYVEYTSESEDNSEIDYQLLLNISYESETQSDFDDLRFTNDTHELDAWLESKVDSSYALVWVKFPTTPANGVNQTYYMYYGNAGVASNWNGEATFLLFDDFTGDLSKWTITTETPSIVSNILELSASDNEEEIIRSDNTYSVGSALRISQKTSVVDMYAIHGLTDTLPNNNIGAGDNIFLYVHPNGNYYYRTGNSGTWTQTSDTGYHDTNWHTNDFCWRAGNVDFYEDNVLISTHTANIPDTAMYVYLRSGFPGHPKTGTVYIDWVFARKYVENPPTYAFGSEEHYIPEGPTTLIEETGLIMSEITTGLKSVNMGNYLVYAFILIGILLIILVIQIISNSIYRG